MSERTKSVLSFEGFPGAGGEIARRAKGKRQLRPGQAGAPKGVAARQALRLRAALARPGPPGPGHPGLMTPQGHQVGFQQDIAVGLGQAGWLWRRLERRRHWRASGCLRGRGPG